MMKRRHEVKLIPVSSRRFMRYDILSKNRRLVHSRSIFRQSQRILHHTGKHSMHQRCKAVGISLIHIAARMNTTQQGIPRITRGKLLQRALTRSRAPPGFAPPAAFTSRTCTPCCSLSAHPCVFLHPSRLAYIFLMLLTAYYHTKAAEFNIFLPYIKIFC